MQPLATCRRCGALLGSEALAVVCPKCMLEVGLEEESEEVASVEGETDWAAADHFSPDWQPKLGRLGDYELLEQIAHGGMGVVYRARQVSLDRVVAVKLLLLGPLASRETIERFHREAQAAASLRHPNIVAIYEVGDVEGQPFFSMDYVAGRSLAQVIAERGVRSAEFGEAADWVRVIAEAVHYAHQHCILHRDLKPANVLIDAENQVRITDFGLAKRLDQDSSLTMTGQTLGSPSYLPPELAAGQHHRVGPASDVYSIGAILYELLTGRPPFLGQSVPETLVQIRDREPLRPRLLKPGIPRDLETICLKCLEKEPGLRFTSAAELAEELGCFLRREPIHTRHVGAMGRLWRWCLRKPVQATLAASLVAALALGLLGVLWQWRRAEATATRETLQRQRAENVLYRLEVQRAQGLLANDNAAAGLAALASMLRQNPTNRAVAEWLMAELTHRNWALPVVEPLAHEEEVHYAEFSPDGRRILTASQDNAARIWDATTGRLLAPPLQHDVKAVTPGVFVGGLKPLWARFSPDGRRIATASADNTARVWDGHTGEAITPPLVHEDWARFAQFSPDGRLLVTTSKDATARLWNATTGEAVGQPLRHAKRVNFAEFSPDGRWVFTGADDNTAQVWDVQTGQPVGKRMQHTLLVKAGQFSPDGQRVATVSEDGTGRIWNAATGEPLSPPLNHNGRVDVVQFSPDGGWLATGSADETVRLWDGFTGASLGRPLAHGGAVRSVQFSPDGRRLLTASEDKTARVWDFRMGRLAVEPMRHEAPVWAARFSPDGQKIVTASSDRTSGVWDVRPGAAIPRELPMTHRAALARWSADSRNVVVVAYYPRVFDAATGRAFEHYLRSDYASTYADFSPDGKRLVTSSDDGRVRVWETDRCEVVLRVQHQTGVNAATFSRDGRWILSAAADRTARMWDANSGQLLLSLQHPGEVSWAEFSLDARLVLTSCANRTVRVWNAQSGQLRSSWCAHLKDITAAHFSPDGTRVVTASKDFTARVWKASSGSAVTGPLAHRGVVYCARFSPDGAGVITASQDNTARLWNASTGHPVGEPMAHGGAVVSADYSPDGKRVVTASEDRTARLWDAATGQPLNSPFDHMGRVYHAEFSPDGRWVVTTSVRSAWIWPVGQSSIPVPGWLPELAEAVAGLRQAAELTTETVAPANFFDLKRAILESTATDPCARWARWLLADRSARSVSPESPLTVAQCLEREATNAAEGVVKGSRDLDNLLVLCPTNGLLFAQAADVALQASDARRDPQALREAGWLSQRAIALAPDQPAAWLARAACLDTTGPLPAALEAMEKASRLPGARAHLWCAWGGLLERAGRDAEALAAYDQALDSNRPAPGLRPDQRRAALLARSRLHAQQGRSAHARADYIRAYELKISPRDPQTPPNLIDLSNYYTAAFDTDWRATRFFRHNLSALPQGRQVFGGVEYDVRGVVQLSSILLRQWGLQYPESVSGIPVGMVCQRLHFLHAADSIGSSRKQLGHYTIHLADAHKEEIAITFDGNVLNWDWEPPDSGVVSYAAWRGASAAGQSIWLFRTTWTNSHPNLAVSTIDFTSAMTECGPFLVAITAE